jgi:hypothetical protein
LEHDTEGKVIGATGYFTNILSILGEKYNYTFVTVTPDDGKWGAPEDNATWNGLIGMLIRDGTRQIFISEFYQKIFCNPGPAYPCAPWMTTNNLKSL